MIVKYLQKPSFIWWIKNFSHHLFRLPQGSYATFENNYQLQVGADQEIDTFNLTIFAGVVNI